MNKVQAKVQLQEYLEFIVDKLISAIIYNMGLANDIKRNSDGSLDSWSGLRHLHGTYTGYCIGRKLTEDQRRMYDSYILALGSMDTLLDLERRSILVDKYRNHVSYVHVEYFEMLLGICKVTEATKKIIELAKKLRPWIFVKLDSSPFFEHDVEEENED
jgi:hypothetical protein